MHTYIHTYFYTHEGRHTQNKKERNHHNAYRHETLTCSRLQTCNKKRKHRNAHRHGSLAHSVYTCMAVTHAYVCIHIHIHTHTIHAYIHTYIYIYIHTGGTAFAKKEETTTASTDMSLLPTPLTPAWLDRVRRSSAAEPLQTNVYVRSPVSESTLKMLTEHVQFAGV
jgi:hypothetical protein